MTTRMIDLFSPTSAILAFAVVIAVFSGVGCAGSTDQADDGALDVAGDLGGEVSGVDSQTGDTQGDVGVADDVGVDLGADLMGDDLAPADGNLAVDEGGGETVCVPECADKECGSDGCGDVCGYCAYGYICNDKQKCRQFCEPDCTDRACGEDGCGGFCGNGDEATQGCEENEYCSETFVCVLKGCEPQCDGRECGPDGCGATCGACDSGFVCIDGTCEVDTSCHDVTSEGRCEGNQLQICLDGVLEVTDCDVTPGLVCGYNFVAKKYDCVEPEVCEPQCSGKECGDDGCEGTCGECEEGEVCSTTGKCGQPCEDLPETGACLDGDDLVAFCHNGIMIVYDCKVAGLVCQYDPIQKAYDCRSPY